MTERELKPGQIVRSLAGRDKGRYFVVLEVRGDNYALVADGDLRRVEKAKKKNLKHLEFHCYVDQVLYGKLSKGNNVTNRELQRALEEAGVLARE